MAQISAGDLIHRPIIEQPPSPDQVDGAGQPDASKWTTLYTVWARIRPLSGRELIAAQSVQNETTHEIAMRWRTGITANMRARWKGRYFNFLNVRNLDEADEWLVILASEGLRSG